MQKTASNQNSNAFDMAIISLDEMNRNDAGIIYDVPDLRLLASLGIRIGKTIKVLTKSFASGPIILAVNGRSIVVDRSVAEKIVVRR